MLTKFGHDHYKNPKNIIKKNIRRSKHTCFQWWQGFVSNDGCLLYAQPFPFWSWELFLFLFPHPANLLSNFSRAYHGSSSAIIINEGRPKPLKAFSNKSLALLGRSRWCWLKVCIGSQYTYTFEHIIPYLCILQSSEGPIKCNSQVLDWAIIVDTDLNQKWDVAKVVYPKFHSGSWPVNRSIVTLFIGAW